MMSLQHSKSIYDIFKQYRKKMISTLNGDDILIESLFVQNVLSEKQYQIVKAEKVPYKSCEKMLDYVLQSGLYGLKNLCEVLDENYSWLAIDIRNTAHANGIDFEIVPNSYNNDILFPLNQKHSIPNESDLMKISKSLVRCDWESILYDLGLQSANIDQCKQSHTLEVMQCMFGLVCWLRENGSAATYEVLYSACANADADKDCLSNIIELSKRITML